MQMPGRAEGAKREAADQAGSDQADPGRRQEEGLEQYDDGKDALS